MYSCFSCKNFFDSHFKSYQRKWIQTGVLQFQVCLLCVEFSHSPLDRRRATACPNPTKPAKKGVIIIIIIIILIMFITVSFIIVINIMVMLILGVHKKQPAGNRARKCMHQKRKARYYHHRCHRRHHHHHHYHYHHHHIIIMTMMMILILILLCRCPICKSLTQEAYLQLHSYATWNQVCVYVFVSALNF
jgi:hypothetical protein